MYEKDMYYFTIEALQKKSVKIRLRYLYGMESRAIPRKMKKSSFFCIGKNLMILHEMILNLISCRFRWTTL